MLIVFFFVVVLILIRKRVQPDSDSPDLLTPGDARRAKRVGATRSRTTIGGVHYRRARFMVYLCGRMALVEPRTTAFTVFEVV